MLIIINIDINIKYDVLVFEATFGHLDTTLRFGHPVKDAERFNDLTMSM